MSMVFDCFKIRLFDCSIVRLFDVTSVRLFLTSLLSGLPLHAGVCPECRDTPVLICFVIHFVY